MDRRAFIVSASLTIAGVAEVTAAQTKTEYVCPPCGCPNDGKVFDAPGQCSVCGMGLVDKSRLNDVSGIANFLKLEDKTWTAGQPTMAQFARLKDEGVTLVINLRSPAESSNLGMTEDAAMKSLGIDYVNIPVVFGNLQASAVDEFLKITDEQLGHRQVLIHCAAAVRVGGFWMIRRVLRDHWSFEKALEEANRIGLNNQPQLIEFARQYIASHQKN